MTQLKLYTVKPNEIFSFFYYVILNFSFIIINIIIFFGSLSIIFL